jgi:hypothetical protein
MAHCNAHSGLKVFKELREVLRHGLAACPQLEQLLDPHDGSLAQAMDARVQVDVC